MPGYSAGLDAKDQLYPETVGWQERSFSLARAVAGMRSGSLIAEIHKGSGLPALREMHSGGDTLLVIHPLWRFDGEFGFHLSGGDRVKFVDTFNLERRPLRAIEMAKLDQVTDDSE
jgi:hypothetical protein